MRRHVGQNSLESEVRMRFRRGQREEGGGDVGQGRRRKGEVWSQRE